MNINVPIYLFAYVTRSFTPLEVPPLERSSRIVWYLLENSTPRIVIQKCIRIYREPSLKASSRWKKGSFKECIFHPSHPFLAQKMSCFNRLYNLPRNRDNPIEIPNTCWACSTESFKCSARQLSASNNKQRRWNGSPCKARTVPFVCRTNRPLLLTNVNRGPNVYRTICAPGWFEGNTLKTQPLCQWTDTYRDKGYDEPLLHTRA